MKSNFKRVMSLVLTVLMVLTAVPFSGLAADECVHEYTYTYDSDGYHIVKCGKCTYRNFELCSGGTATCAEKAKCSKCNTEYGELSTVHGATKIVITEDNLVSEATCQSPAIYYYVCKVCGGNTEETFEFGDVNPDAHVYDEAQSNENGTHKATCTLCQTPAEDAPCFDEEPTVNAPTCTEKGYTENTCDACGYEWVSDEKEANGHDFSEKIADEAHLRTPATCTAKATYWFDCKDCGVIATEETAADKYYEDGEMLPHDFTAEKAEEKYIVSAANCQQKAVYYKSCADCGLSSKDTAFVDTFEGDKGTHSWGEYVYNKDAKCGVDGTKTAPCTIPGCDAKDTITAEGTALEHVYDEKLVDEAHLKDAATCTKLGTYWFDCSREGCNASAKDNEAAADKFFEAGELAAHAYTEEIADEAHLKDAATCIAKATYWYDCANCDKSAKDDTAAADKFFESGDFAEHSFTKQAQEEAYILEKATCTTDAIYWYACAQEGCTASPKSDTPKDADWYIAEKTAFGHDIESIPGKDPTCTEDGYTDSRKCKTCGTWTKEQAKREALGHEEYISVAKVEATCTKVGHSEEKKCARCETLLSLPSYTTAALGHVDEDGDEICDRTGCGTIVVMGEDCSCLCHQTGIMKIIYMLVRLIWKLIGANPYCDCGIQHY